METFEAYLLEKKIDSEAFRKGEPAQWQDFATLFGQVHPDSFTAQKLFLINAIRRRYPLAEEPVKKPPVAKVRPKPNIRIPKRPG